MSNPALFDGSRLLSWSQRAAAELERRRVEINQLNVFPVPDADTGSNMAHTMASAVSEAEKLAPGATAEQVAEALALGSMRGARGNSGVVLSQVIRGMAQSVGEDELSGEVIAEALASGVGFVDRAFTNPVEGTVITVLRAAAEAAGRTSGGSLEQVATAARDAARDALEATPSQNDALRHAGVVDAGGTGLVILLEQLVDEVAGRDPSTTAVPVRRIAPEDEGHGSAGYLEVMFYFDGPLDELENTLVELGGDSLVIARGSETTGTVHVHTRNAGAVIEAAFGAGAVSDLRVEVLPESGAEGARRDRPQRVVLAVSPPGSLTQLYTEAGVMAVAPGADDDATASAVLAAARESAAREVILLTNGLLSRSAVRGVETALDLLGLALAVVPTDDLVSGVAALAVHDDTQSLEAAAVTMAEAANEMRTAVVDTGGHDDAVGALTDACSRLLAGGGELVSVLFDPLRVPGLDSARLGADLPAEVRVYPADGLGSLAQIGVE